MIYLTSPDYILDTSYDNLVLQKKEQIKLYMIKKLLKQK